MVRALLAVCLSALVCVAPSAAGRAGGPTVQEVTITGGGGVQLACDLTLPPGAAPDGGWPGLVIFPGLGESHTDEEHLDQAYFATYDGLASVSCDERGTGSSGGSFDLAGPHDAEDAQAIFDWLTARPEVSDTQIGGDGWELGGAEVWNAAVTGVPFKAMIAGVTWSSLRWALKPTGVLNARLFQLLSTEGPTTWNTTSGIAARSYRTRIHSLAIPTLLVQEREENYFDLSQATAAYRLLSGPKRLDIGWQVEGPGEGADWFQHYLAGGPRTYTGVALQREKPEAGGTLFRRLPPTRSLSVNLTGDALMRSVLLPGGPLETFGAGGSVTIRYSGASWGQVVATVSTAAGKEVTEGAAPVKHRAGVMTIPLLNEVRFLPRGKKLTVTLSNHDATFGGGATGTIAVGRVTLRLSVLARAASR